MQRVSQSSSTLCFDCVYTHRYRINPCSHTICQNCLYAAIEEKLRLHHDNIICPRCTDSEARLKYVSKLENLNRGHDQRDATTIPSRKELSPLTLMLRYDCIEVAPQINGLINDIVDTQERQRVEKVL